jgi:tRNA pseudouridine13 synthase
MRFRVRPEDFMVEEQVRLPLTQKGPYALYEVRKREVTTMEVQARIAATLGIPRSAVLFPALKDRHSMAVQHAAIKGTGPTVLEGRGYRARFVGRATRPLQPRDLRGNRFTVTVRDLRPGGARRLRGRLTDLERFGLPNYFDRQRFGSYAPNAGFPGKRILQRDVEGALQAYLRESLRGDPSPVRAFKSVAREHWGDWDVLFESAPRPSNFRSVLTFLRDHPADFRKALNLDGI